MSIGKIPPDSKIWLDNLPIIAPSFKHFYWHSRPVSHKTEAKFHRQEGKNWQKKKKKPFNVEQNQH
jgi:hypothetical protein